MTVTLLGNCQVKALTWYIQQLNPEFDVQWIQPEFSIGHGWADNEIFCHNYVPTIKGIENSHERLRRSSFLIYQHLKPETSKNYNFRKIKSYNPKCHFISISSFFYDLKRKGKKRILGMIERAEELNIDIPAHKIIEKYGAVPALIYHRHAPAHPRALYFLELTKEICISTGWNYYSEEQYNQLLKNDWPWH